MRGKSVSIKANAGKCIERRNETIRCETLCVRTSFVLGFQRTTTAASLDWVYVVSGGGTGGDGVDLAGTPLLPLFHCPHTSKVEKCQIYFGGYFFASPNLNCKKMIGTARVVPYYIGMVEFKNFHIELVFN